jgi:hypothetical protein
VLGSKIQIGGWTTYASLLWVLKGSLLAFFMRLTVCSSRSHRSPCCHWSLRLFPNRSPALTGFIECASILEWDCCLPVGRLSWALFSSRAAPLSDTGRSIRTPEVRERFPLVDCPRIAPCADNRALFFRRLSGGNLSSDNLDLPRLQRGYRPVPHIDPPADAMALFAETQEKAGIDVSLQRWTVSGGLCHPALHIHCRRKS